MAKSVLILGGRGKIGRAIAQDLQQFTDAQITITGRRPNSPALLAVLPDSVRYHPLDLADEAGLSQAIRQHQLVIHCAGPFHSRDDKVLRHCIEAHVDYLDVSDHRSYYCRVIAHQAAAQAAGITAILNTGIFPGISNSMVRQAMEQLDSANRIHLSYVVAGSGGAGLTVMRTTFLGLLEPFEVWQDNRWQTVLPYSDREQIEFPAPFGTVGVYWFDVPEAYTFADSFAVPTIVTKFGSVPEFYNTLTWLSTRLMPSSWIKQPWIIEGLSRISYAMTQISDHFTGEGVTMRVAIDGIQNNQAVQYLATMVHHSTAEAAGYGSGNVAELLLSGQLHQPGIWPVEQVLPTALFETGMKRRGLVIDQDWKKPQQVIPE